MAVPRTNSLLIASNRLKRLEQFTKW